tara:strand:- start:69 stop:2204 length:2136 start_codon:yes stop_codon:yes gene_type:complete
MINQEVKGTLAKLLATENLTVEHRKVSTAYFDVEKRILCLPIWKTASATVYDLLVGHEVGHALYTPSDDLRGISKPFVNVLEDARIERMMKQTYPGLKRSFFEGYKELWDDDFFGVRDEEIANLPLIDRINLYFKGNPEVPFGEDEMVWVDRASKTKTFQDVLQLAAELYDYAQEKQEKKETEQQTPETSSSDTTTEEEQVEEMEKQQVENESSDDGESEEQDESDWFTDDDPMEREPKMPDEADLGTPSYEYDETESVTDAALRESLESMVDDSAKEWVYLSLPNPDLDKIVVPCSEIQEKMNDYYYNRDDDGYYFDNIEYALDKYRVYKKDSVKTVNYLVKQFEMKKSADEYRRAATSRTGVLDTNKLFKYKMTDDIFKKVTVIPEGKNHGLVMYLDWSGSMADVLLDTLKQTYNLIWFCKKAGIPFRVYAFQSGAGNRELYDYELNVKENDLHMHDDFKMLEFFSSKQNSKSLEKSMQLVFLHVFAMRGYRIPYMSLYGLGGTPLTEAVYCTRQLVANLKKVEHVSKVNVVCLTDGESNPMASVQSRNVYYDDDKEFRGSYLCHSSHKVFILRDPVTGYSRKINTTPYHTTKEIVSFMREVTDYNWIGIRICSKGELTRLVREYYPEKMDSIDKQWKKERYATMDDRVGFTEAFYLPNTNLGNESSDLEVKTKKEVATKAELTRAFKKHMGSKMANKTVLNKFIEQIA